MAPTNPYALRAVRSIDVDWRAIDTLAQAALHRPQEIGEYLIAPGASRDRTIGQVSGRARDVRDPEQVIEKVGAGSSYLPASAGCAKMALEASARTEEHAMALPQNALSAALTSWNR